MKLNNLRKQLLFVFIGIFVIAGISLSIIFLKPSTIQSTVAGARTVKENALPTPTPTPTMSPSVTPIPTHIIKRSISPTTISKQKGGWYWNASNNRAQVWLGIDSEGRDIWADSFPEPTATPTPYQQSSYQGTNTGTNTNSVVIPNTTR